MLLLKAAQEIERLRAENAKLKEGPLDENACIGPGQSAGFDDRCPQCYGDGWLHDADVKCPTCKGTGREIAE